MSQSRTLPAEQEYIQINLWISARHVEGLEDPFQSQKFRDIPDNKLESYDPTSISYNCIGNCFLHNLLYVFLTFYVHVSTFDSTSSFMSLGMAQTSSGMAVI